MRTWELSGKCYSLQKFQCDFQVFDSMFKKEKKKKKNVFLTSKNK